MRWALAAQVGQGLLEGFGGRAVKLVHAADGSAGRLVTLLTATFPGFRDHCIYKNASPLYRCRHLTLCLVG